jgi:hypothetical protein
MIFIGSVQAQCEVVPYGGWALFTLEGLLRRHDNPSVHCTLFLAVPDGSSLPADIRARQLLLKRSRRSFERRYGPNAGSASLILALDDYHPITHMEPSQIEVHVDVSQEVEVV